LTRTLFLAIAIAVALLVVPPPIRAELGNELVPAYSGVYDDLKILSTRGLVPGVPTDTRPMTRNQVAAVIAKGLSSHRVALLEDPLGMRLVREFCAEIGARGLDAPCEGRVPFWRREVDSGDGGARIELIPYAWVRVDNVEPIYFRKLADRRIGARGTFSTAGGMLVIHSDLVAGNHSAEPRGIPDFGTLNALVEGEDFNSWVQRAYVRIDTRVIDVLYGRDWLRWGPGRTGTLGLGDASQAVNHLLLQKRTSRFDFTTFVATLDFSDEGMLAGHRLEARLTQSLTVGVAEQARFKSIQQAPLYLFAFYPYSLAEKIVGVDSQVDEDIRNNVMWTIDADWALARGTRLYGEFLLDDLSFSSDKKPTQIGYQLGVTRSGLGGLGALVLQAEFTKIYRYTYSQARRRAGEDGSDSLYGLDFEHNGYSLGHPIGPDAEAYFVAARYDASPASKWDLSLEVRRSGEGGLGEAWTTGDPIPDTSELSGVVETETRVMLGYTYYPEFLHGSRLGVGGGLYRATNEHNVEGHDRGWEGIMQASALVSW
jgi:hypothetical protein